VAGGPGDGDEELARLRRQLDGEDVRDAARAVLDPTEDLRLLGEGHPAYGDSGPATDTEPVELQPSPGLERLWGFCTRTAPRRIVSFAVFAPFMAVLALDSIGPSTLLDRLIGGRTCEGRRGSVARQVEQAFSTFSGRADLYAVSDRRLLLMRSNRYRSGSPPELAIVASIPRAAIAGARRRPRGLFRRRVELSFVDGSRIVLALPFFASAKLNEGPKRLVTELAPLRG
jgi:hypothetical protein